MQLINPSCPYTLIDLIRTQTHLYPVLCYQWTIPLCCKTLLPYFSYYLFDGCNNFLSHLLIYNHRYSIDAIYPNYIPYNMFSPWAISYIILFRFYLNYIGYFAKTVCKRGLSVLLRVKMRKYVFVSSAYRYFNK